MEDFSYVLDFLPTGFSNSRYNEPIAFTIGDKEFRMFKVLIKKGVSLEIHERLYQGKDKERRDKTERILHPVSYDEITPNAKTELVFALEEIVDAQESRFMEFFNSAGPVTNRFHSLELLPGLGKKKLKDLLRNRPFKSFQDIVERTSISSPQKLLAKCIEKEVIDNREKYKLFVIY